MATLPTAPDLSVTYWERCLVPEEVRQAVLTSVRHYVQVKAQNPFTRDYLSGMESVLVNIVMGYGLSRNAARDVVAHLIAEEEGQVV